MSAYAKTLLLGGVFAGVLRVDRFGDPLPAGAVARMGTVRWRVDGGTTFAIACPARGNVLVAANQARPLLHFDTRTGELVRRIPGSGALPAEPDEYKTAIAFSGDRSKAAFGEADGTVRVLDALTGQENCRWQAHRELIHCCALSGDGQILATRSKDGTLRVWATQTGKRLHQWPAPANPHGQAEIEYLSVCLSPDGQTLAWLGYEDRTCLHVCDLATGKQTHQLRVEGGSFRGMAISADSQTLAAFAAVPNYEGRLLFWDPKSGKHRRSSKGAAGNWLSPCARRTGSCSRCQAGASSAG